ncbi:MAG: branched-chain-amino-acid transaminase [Nitrospirae bacterium RBG_16_43_11]|nr:MAG: branched-chain-amino-acid transaminase [Nitrospirae bacterium RBG_16_43_11]
MLIFINGLLIPQDEAKVSVLDRGFLYGDGVFETLRAYSGKIFRIDDHIKRLFCSANAICLKTPFTGNYIKESLYQTLMGNNLKDAYLRLTITRGISDPGLDTEGCLNPTMTIISREFSGYPEDLYRHGIKAAVVSTRRIPASALNPEIKSLNFLNNIMARMEAKHANASEAIMLSTEGYVAEGTVSNIFIVKDGVVKTPPLSVGILNGVTRSLVIGLAQKNNIPLTEQQFQPEELYAADECFVTSTLYEVMPVTSINNKPVGTGHPGDISQSMLSIFRELTTV